MFSSLAVTVLTPVYGEYDRLGNPTVTSWAQSEVEGVLVAPGASSDLEAARPDGVAVALTLHFPRWFDASLRGCCVAVPAPYRGTYRVIGDPKPYMAANCPGNWYMPVEVEAADG